MGFTQEDLADKVGISRAYMGYIEQGRNVPSLEIVEKIAQVSKLFFFSTEIALTENGQFIVVDYVNESCDIRLQSKALDGVPDQIVKNSADYIIRYVKKQLESPTPQL